MKKVVALLCTVFGLFSFAVINAAPAEALMTRTNCATFNRPFGHDPEICAMLYYADQNDNIGYLVHKIRIWNDDGCAGLETNNPYAVQSQGTLDLYNKNDNVVVTDVGPINPHGNNDCDSTVIYPTGTRPSCNTDQLCYIRGTMKIRLDNANDDEMNIDLFMKP